MGYVYMPRMDEKAVLAVESNLTFRVAKDSENLDTVLDFLNYMCTSDYGRSWVPSVIGDISPLTGADAPDTQLAAETAAAQDNSVTCPWWIFKGPEGVEEDVYKRQVTDFVVTFADDSNIVNLHGWSQGSFSGMSWSNVYISCAVIGVTLLLTFLLSKPIGAYQLGEAYAQSMGVNIKFFRVALILLSSILSATVTAFAGPISFVGIAVPFLMKRSFGTSRPLIIIPGTFLGGAVFCMMCDLIARMAFAPLELNISTVTRCV